MIWPPVKAWTYKSGVKVNRHFVAINYGGKLEERWVILMSVLDSSLVVKVSWFQLIDPANWECGWDDNKNSNYSILVNNKSEKGTIKLTHISTDSGLTIPITKNVIRPWFENI